MIAAILGLALQSAAPSAPPAFVIDGAPIEFAEFASWLIDVAGENELQAFAGRMRVHSEGAAQARTAPPTAIAAAVEEAIASRVRNAFGGGREAWLAELAELGSDEATQRALLGDDAAVELTLAALVRAERTIDESRLRATFEQRYGPGGIALQGEVLVVEIAYPPRAAGTSREDANAARAAAEAAAAAFAGELRARAENGASLAELARAPRPDGVRSVVVEGPLRITDGVTTREEHERLAVGALSTPQMSRGAWRFARILARHEARFAECAPALESELREAAPLADESSAWLSAAKARRPLSVLPALAEHDWPAPLPSLPVVRVGELEFPAEELAGSLALRHGAGLARSFVADVLVRARARASGVDLEDEQVSARVGEILAARIEHEHGGDEEEFERALVREGLSRDDLERRLAAQSRTDLLVAELLRRDEPQGDERLQTLFAQRYGPAGISLRVRGIAVAPGEDVLDRARALRRRIVEGGADFAALARDHSSDPASAASGGDLGAPLHETRWGAATTALAGLAPGTVAEPLAIDGTVWIFEVLDRRVTEFSAVRATLADELARERFSPSRLAAFANGLTLETPWTMEPGLLATAVRLNERAVLRARGH